MGDGGDAGDPDENGEDPTTLLGSILRLDVDGGGQPLDCASGTGSATVPADNPFVDTASACDEIWAYGFRNPWRMTLDPATGQIWTGDVGQNAWEEIDILERGGNFGWDILEGTHCFEPSSGCSTDGTVLPVWEYSHSLGCSITGGYVYRGSAIPELVGEYVYSDYCSGRVWRLDYDGSTAEKRAVFSRPPCPPRLAPMPTASSTSCQLPARYRSLSAPLHSALKSRLIRTYQAYRFVGLIP